MEALPAEILLNVGTFLPSKDVVHLQQVCRKFRKIYRDALFWRDRCAERSYVSLVRRGERALSDVPGIGCLVRQMEELGSSSSSRSSLALSRTSSRVERIEPAKLRARAVWELYPGETVDYYEEYIHRNAPISLNWFQRNAEDQSCPGPIGEAQGMGALYDGGARSLTHVVGSMDNGSICIWDARPNHLSKIEGGQGKLVGRSSRGLLAYAQGTHPQAPPNGRVQKFTTTTRGAVECMSIDSFRNRGYVAVRNALVCVDLNTLQRVSSEDFDTRITALSECSPLQPLTVGLRNGVGLYDHRTPGHNGMGALGEDIVEGFNDNRFSPQCILHDPETASCPSNGVWLAGSFPSLLCLDRRRFPQILHSIHTGSTAAMCHLPHPFTPHHLNSHPAPFTHPAIGGHTLVAAGSYRGRGSLDFVTLAPASDGGPLRPTADRLRNRQTAASSKLLSVARHGTRIAYADADGQIRWMERDGFHPVRRVRVRAPCAMEDNRGGGEMASGEDDEEEAEEGVVPRGDAAGGSDDLVRKILPTVNPAAGLEIPGTATRREVNTSDLLVLTDSGHVGMLTFGARPRFDVSRVGQEAVDAAEAARRAAERRYEQEMRSALKAQADEVRWFRRFI